MNESQTKINCHINYRNRIHDIVNMRKKKIMNNSIVKKHELHKIF